MKAVREDKIVQKYLTSLETACATASAVPFQRELEGKGGQYLDCRVSMPPVMGMGMNMAMELGHMAGKKEEALWEFIQTMVGVYLKNSQTV